jgi:hypothetical protein
MPMQGGPFFWPCNTVVNCDLDDVPPVRLNGWSWELAVNQKYIFLIAVRGYGSSTYCEVIISNHSSVRSLCVGVAPSGGKKPPWKSAW